MARCRACTSGTNSRTSLWHTPTCHRVVCHTSWPLFLLLKALLAEDYRSLEEVALKTLCWRLEGFQHRNNPARPRSRFPHRVLSSKKEPGHREGTKSFERTHTWRLDANSRDRRIIHLGLNGFQHGSVQFAPDLPVTNQHVVTLLGWCNRLCKQQRMNHRNSFQYDVQVGMWEEPCHML